MPALAEAISTVEQPQIAVERRGQSPPRFRFPFGPQGGHFDYIADAGRILTDTMLQSKLPQPKPSVNRVLMSPSAFAVPARDSVWGL